ncbi:hypothetical protein OBRU01_19060 [Operophtera brumata]|uniref:Uncharacterized protein n=1 Tax=Operophtera brumata TaxID=104452 RepID=A0A0L7KY33_OPEBR|nr:hypothetical protein OBRU01_19060 [Operophtera brumata]
MCKEEFKIKNSHENLNKNAVTGAMVAGCGNAQLQNFTAALDLPRITPHMYKKSHDQVCQAWEETSWDEMRKAGEEERQAAIAEGKVTHDGTPVIDVIIDGCWCRRSYRTNYAALSGAATIIGRRFGKVLFFSVRNKYCCICARAEKRGEDAKEHTCYKNFTGPSTAMESEILVEGFKRSIEMHQTDNYGEHVDRPDMDLEIFEMAKATFLKNLEKSEIERQEIQETTKLQSESGECLELRRKLLTSSNFGKVVKRRKTNSCANMVQNLLYQPNVSHVASVNHGSTHEKIAREQVSEMLKEKIDLCGLFIDEHQPFLGCSPDGVISNENTLVEIKCPIVPYKIGIDEAIKGGKMHFWKVDKKTGQTYVNKNSDWFMQVQGQMHICKAPRCVLAVWYGDNKIKIEIIERDDRFWQERMEPCLSAFYFDCLLPELVDPRFSRGKPIREPSYVKLKEKPANMEILKIKKLKEPAKQK